MGLNTSDKRDIVINYVKELGFRPAEVSRNTGIPVYTINQMLECEDWFIDEEVLNKILAFLEGRKAAFKKPSSCINTGCDALRKCLDDKEQLVAILKETVARLREENKMLRR